MTDTPQITEVDCSTGIATTRDMTPAEITAQAEMAEQAAEQQAAVEAEAAAKAEAKASAEAKLAALGLTADEVAALVG
jgi:hypothetical protein